MCSRPVKFAACVVYLSLARRIIELNDPRLDRYISSAILGHKLWIVMEYLGGGSVLDLVWLRATRTSPAHIHSYMHVSTYRAL
jgi:hypothetical protein